MLYEIRKLFLSMKRKRSIAFKNYRKIIDAYDNVIKLNKCISTALYKNNTGRVVLLREILDINLTTLNSQANYAFTEYLPSELKAKIYRIQNSPKKGFYFDET